MRALGRRLGRVEAAARARRADLAPALLVVDPAAWPEADRAAYDAARVAGDGAAEAALVERHAGRRPGPATLVIAVRVRADGAQ